MLACQTINWLIETIAMQKLVMRRVGQFGCQA